MRPSPLDRPFPANEITDLQARINAAAPGDVIELETGTYTGRVIISGRPGLTLRAAPGADPVLTLRDPRFAAPNALWTQVVGQLYRTTEPVGLSVYFADGRRIMWAKTSAHFSQLAQLGIPTAFRNGAETLIALCGLDPRVTPLMVSASDQPVIQCIDSPRVHLEGLDVRFGGAQCIDFRGGCDDSMVYGVSVYGGRDGIRVKDGASSNVIVRRCWIANDLRPEWFYRDVKGNTAMEGSAVLLPGDRQEAEDNVIEGWFNGIQTYSAVRGSSDVQIRWNLIRDILDDAIELDGYCDRGKIYENYVADAFVGLSFDPRLVHDEGQPTLIYRNSFTLLRRPNFDRATETSAATVGRPSFIKLQPSAKDGQPYGPRDLAIYHNTIVADAEIVKGAPQGSFIAYPVRVRWFNNVFVSRVGPIVRHTGTQADGNELEGNLYWQIDRMTGRVFEDWGTPVGKKTFATMLEGARDSEAGVAARWEHAGLDAPPMLSFQMEASSLRAGSPAIASGIRLPDGLEDTSWGPDRGAWPVSPGISLYQVERSESGWVYAFGRDFDSETQVYVAGVALLDQVVLSSRQIVGRLPEQFTRPVTVSAEKGATRALLLDVTL
jgi:hypothetical protein